MARLVTDGFDVPIYSSSAVQSGSAQGSRAGTLANDTSVVHTPGGSSLKVTGAAGSMTYLTAIPNGTAILIRCYVRYTDVDAFRTFLDVRHSGGTVVRLRWSATGGIQVLDAAAAQVGSLSANLSPNTWTKLELAAQLHASPTTGNGFVVARVDGLAFVTTFVANLGTTATDRVTLGPSTPPFGTYYFDDLAINDNTGASQNALPGSGFVKLLLPTADSSNNGAGADVWEQPQTTGSDTTSIFDSVDNNPPQGVAHSDADANNLKYIFNADGAGATFYDATMQSYDAVGVPASGTIKVVQGLVRVGGASTTGTNDAKGQLLSNPADAAATTFTGAFDIVSGTEVTSGTPAWQTFLTQQQIDPTVTRATAPVLEVVKHEATTRVMMVDLMAVLVEYAPASTGAAIAGAGTVSATGTRKALSVGTLTGTGTIAASGTRKAVAAGAIAGSGAVSATGLRKAQGAASILGAGAIAATGTRKVLGAAAVSGTGTVSATGHRRYTGAAALSGAGAIVAAGTRKVLGTASVAGAGSVSATATRTALGAAAITGTGGLNATGARTVVGVASLAGTGSVAATGVRTTYTGASVAGTGSVAASGTRIGTSSVAIAGAGSITVTGTRRTFAAAAIAGAGSISATGAVRYVGAAAIAGAGTISASGHRRFLGVVVISGMGAISATGLRTAVAAASISGTGTIHATGTFGAAHLLTELVAGFLPGTVGGAEAGHLTRDDIGHLDFDSDDPENGHIARDEQGHMAFATAGKV